MRRNLSLLVAVGLALGACAQTTRWEKPQASDEATAADLDDCHVQARKEAFRVVGPYPAGYPYYGPSLHRGWRGNYGWWLHQEQYFTESRLASFCMRNKGYQRVAIETPNS